MKKVKKVIVEAIREVKNKAQIVAEEVSNVIAPKKENNLQKSTYIPKNGGQNKPRNGYQKSVRFEIIPDHIREDFVAPVPQTTATKESILARLRSAGY
ncbi:hypothetical protein [Bacillus sp. MUM 116]|uniref:hypothetical protein n=1 Tax=Bacillus sp. MUM 116 TaxID=1678002 RepID=UPI00114D40CD|nr:hypothetical protein [Bacillus sp. MUM 116]